MKNILVSMDFKKNEKKLVDQAFHIAEAFKAKIWLVHITEPIPDHETTVVPQSMRDIRAAELRVEHKLIQDYANELKQKGVDAEGLLIQGAIIEMVIEEAQKLNIDLIIAGHHEHNFLYKSFIGDISAEVIKKSKIPVLIVPVE